MAAVTKLDNRFANVTASNGMQQQAHNLSANQERFWFLDQYEADASVLNLSCVLAIHGTVSDAVIEDVILQTIARHPLLRQRFYPTPNGTRRAMVSNAPQIETVSIRIRRSRGTARNGGRVAGEAA